MLFFCMASDYCNAQQDTIHNSQQDTVEDLQSDTVKATP